MMLGGCEKEERELIYEYQEQTFQITLDKACKEHTHKQPTFHHPDLDGIMCDYVFDGEQWKEIIYDKELTDWATNHNLHKRPPRTKEEIEELKKWYKENWSDKYIFSDKWERTTQ